MESYCGLAIKEYCIIAKEHFAGWSYSPL